jgi:CPA2 family monovalent cation:H+ antiporter-2
VVVAIALGKAILILIPVTLVAYKLVPRLMRKVMQAANPEFFVLVALALGFMTAALTHAVGLSLALGAFLAGLLVSETATAHETMRHLSPLRDAFVALFFVTVGILVNPRVLFSRPALLLVIVALVVLGKLGVWIVVVQLFRYPMNTALKVGLGLTQIGEFSYVLVRVARNAHIVGDDIYNATLAASVVTILVNGLLMRLFPDTSAGKGPAV